MEEGFIRNTYIKFVKYSNLNPLLLYDMTINEISLLFEAIDEKYMMEFENEANAIRIGVATAMSGKEINLFKDTKSKKIVKKNREEELSALDDL